MHDEYYPWKDRCGGLTQPETIECLVHWEEAEIKLACGDTVMADVIFRFTIDSEPADPGCRHTPPTAASHTITEEKLEKVVYYDDEGNGKPWVVGVLAAPLIDQFWAGTNEERVLENIQDDDIIWRS